MLRSRTKAGNVVFEFCDAILPGNESGYRFELARRGAADLESLSRDASGGEDLGALGVERVARGLEFRQGALYAEEAFNIDRGGRRPERISHIVRQIRARRRAAATTGSLQAARSGGLAGTE